MKALAVLSPSLAKKMDERDIYFMDHGDERIPIGIIETEEIKFEASSLEFENQVLVKKHSFSINYRDLALIRISWDSMKKYNYDDYYALGSDFCGTVIDCGKGVKEYEIGDLVFNNGSYPIAKDDGPSGLPTNNGSYQKDCFHYSKLKKIPKHLVNNLDIFGSVGIGLITSGSMIRRTDIKEGENVLVTSPTSNTSLFLLSLLENINCNIYTLSYFGNYQSDLIEYYPKIKQTFQFEYDEIPNDLKFDVVLDPFIDTYLSYIITKMNFFSRYITCGFYKQYNSLIESKKIKLDDLATSIIFNNISIIGNCLGSDQDLEYSLNSFIDNSMRIPFDRLYNKDSYIGDFIEHSFNLNHNKFGKVLYAYDN